MPSRAARRHRSIRSHRADAASWVTVNDASSERRLIGGAIAQQTTAPMRRYAIAKSRRSSRQLGGKTSVAFAAIRIHQTIRYALLAGTTLSPFAFAPVMAL